MSNTTDKKAVDWSFKKTEPWPMSPELIKFNEWLPKGSLNDIKAVQLVGGPPKKMGDIVGRNCVVYLVVNVASE